MPEISIKAEKIFEIGSLNVTNALFLSFITLILIISVAYIVNKRAGLVPNHLQSLFELMLEQILGLMDSVLGNRKASVKYLPLIATIFLFVMISNWMGLVPGAGSIGVREHLHGHEVLVPLFRAPASDLNFTLAIAVISVLAVNLLAIIALGAKRHAKKFFTLKNPIYTFTGILELISEFVKIISFSFRLFGNVFAGEVLLIIIGFLVPYIIPLPFLFLEIFVGFIQAFIFSMLTLVFVAMAVSEETAH